MMNRFMGTMKRLFNPKRKVILLAPSGLWGVFELTPSEIQLAKKHDYGASPNDEEYEVGLANLPATLRRPNIIAVHLMMQEPSLEAAMRATA